MGVEVKTNLCVIDADSIIYIIASKYSRIKIKSAALADVDDFIADILKKTYSKEYIGYFGKIGGAKNFRYNIAKTKPYKGTRSEKEDWYIYWEKIIKKHMANVWKFIPVEYVEADDMCVIAATKFKKTGKYARVYIASPDKDLRQAGDTWFYNYGKRIEEFITKDQGLRNFYIQTIVGDTTDNIQGIFGVGSKGAHDIVNSVKDASTLPEVVKAYYLKYYREIIPEKQRKKAEKNFLDSYKKAQGLKRYTKATKQQALAAFGQGGKFPVPSEEEVMELFKENYALLYMLRTEDELAKYWKEYPKIEPVKDRFLDWEKIDQERSLVEADIEVEDFEDEVYDDINLDLNEEDYEF